MLTVKTLNLPSVTSNNLICCSACCLVFVSCDIKPFNVSYIACFIEPWFVMMVDDEGNTMFKLTLQLRLAVLMQMLLDNSDINQPL